MDQSAVFVALSKNARFNKKKEKPRKTGIVVQPEVTKEDHDDDEKVRTMFRIRTKGSNVPSLVLSFNDLTQSKFSSLLIENIESSRFKDPTPIQMQTIPAILEGRDVLGIAPTGSGKTASYLIPRLLSLNQTHEDSSKHVGIHTLVVIPTHELADQIIREHNWLSEHFPRHLRKGVTLTKHSKKSILDSALGKTFHCLVTTTPLLLLDLLCEVEDRKAQVNCIVFDEADRLFEQTFVQQTDSILHKLREEHSQRLMFSATMPPKIESVVDTLLRDSVKVTIANGKTAETISQKLVYCGTEQGKSLGFEQLLKQGKIAPPCLIFVKTKDHAKRLLRELQVDTPAQLRLLLQPSNIDAIHGERPPKVRDELVEKFRQGKELWFLISTEVLARGIDFRHVNTVINWDLPKDCVSYIHRIGRCGRAGRQGSSITFFTDDDVEDSALRSIANLIQNSRGPTSEADPAVPKWIFKLKKKKWKGPSNTTSNSKRAKLEQQEQDE